MNQRDASRQNWSSSNTVEEINSGCLQRIADATEKMAMNYTTLLNERDRYYKWYMEQQEVKEKLYRRISALKGVITRMKKKNNS